MRENDIFKPYLHFATIFFFPSSNGFYKKIGHFMNVEFTIVLKAETVNDKPLLTIIQVGKYNGNVKCMDILLTTFLPQTV